MQPLTYTFTELCAAANLGSPKTARARLKQWQAHGFPQALPGHGHKLWSRPQVDAWLHNWGTTEKPSPALRAGEGGAHAPDEGQAAHRQPPTITTLQSKLEETYLARKTA